MLLTVFSRKHCCTKKLISPTLKQNTKVMMRLLVTQYQKAVSRRCSIKKVFLKVSQNSQENTCVRVSFLIKLQALACNFIKRECLAHMFSCTFCEIFKNTFFTEHLWTTTSEYQEFQTTLQFCMLIEKTLHQYCSINFALN